MIMNNRLRKLVMMAAMAAPRAPCLDGLVNDNMSAMAPSNNPTNAINNVTVRPGGKGLKKYRRMNTAFCMLKMPNTNEVIASPLRLPSAPCVAAAKGAPC